MKHNLLFSLLILLCCWACGPEAGRSQQGKHVDISESIYFLDFQEEKVYAYLETLQALEVLVNEIFHEDNEQYSLIVEIIQSNKLSGKTRQETEQIASRIGLLLVSSIDYAAYYEDIHVYIKDKVSETEDSEEKEEIHVQLSVDDLLSQLEEAKSDT